MRFWNSEAAFFGLIHFFYHPFRVAAIIELAIESTSFDVFELVCYDLQSHYEVLESYSGLVVGLPSRSFSLPIRILRSYEVDTYCPTYRGPLIVLALV